ncbi:hypothetical protein MJ575_15940 [Klebsiella pneumoniae]|nr:hypothetical protein MJ575_15940 [Klebsiella pneumoniae]
MFIQRQFERGSVGQGADGQPDVVDRSGLMLTALALMQRLARAVNLRRTKRRSARGKMSYKCRRAT